MKISAVIITYNEERNIERCLQSLVGVADEIVVVDSLSTDSTAAICRKYNVAFIEQKFLGYIEQKNFAADKATHEYVLSLDADELLSPELQNWLLQEKQAAQPADAYKFNRLNNYCGQWIKHGAYYPDRKLRLWKNGIGKWGGENPHDQFIPTTDVPTKIIALPILHYSFATRQEHVQQMQKFSSIAANTMQKKGKKANALRPWLSAIWSFINGYIIKMGWLDGANGLFIAITNARYTYWKYAKLRALNQNAQ
ncbi:MAG TPA: glycosyltransferase family 2 protein [Phnomibacter sp.]|nr:glycosyltransferase family 2 protein [Phnomibacter sp.]